MAKLGLLPRERLRLSLLHGEKGPAGIQRFAKSIPSGGGGVASGQEWEPYAGQRYAE